MDAFFQWIANNSIASNALVISFCILLLFFIVVYLVGFFQGREISFWPPKIGAKLDSSNVIRNQKTKPSSVDLNNRQGFSVPLEERIANAREVYLLGLNLVGLVSHFEGIISEKAGNGCKFRIITLDSDFFATPKLPTSWYGSLRRKQDLEQSHRVWAHLLTKSTNIQVRMLPLPPPFSLLLIDPGKDHGEVQVEFYTYQPSASSRPHFILKKPQHTEWYDYFRNEFELAWQQAGDFTR